MCACINVFVCVGCFCVKKHDTRQDNKHEGDCNPNHTELDRSARLSKRPSPSVSFLQTIVTDRDREVIELP